MNYNFAFLLVILLVSVYYTYIYNKLKYKIMSKTVQEQVAKGKLLVSGLRNNIEEAKSRNISIEIINRLDELCQTTEKEGSAQDEIKEMYHKKTAEVSALMLELKNSINDIKKYIKPYYTQSEWIKFGIEDKK